MADRKYEEEYVAACEKALGYPPVGAIHLGSACYIGDLPEQCAALNRTNINVQLLTIEAAMTLKKEKIYQAAMMDPHLQSELSIDDIVSLCDDMIAAHAGWMPEYQ